MKRIYIVFLLQCVTSTFLLSQSNPLPLPNQSPTGGLPISAPRIDAKVQARILDSYGKLPLSFEANQGDTDGRVKFISRTSGYSLFLTGDEAVLALTSSRAKTKKTKIARPASTSPSSTAAAPKAGGVLRMKLRNANPVAKVTGLDQMSSRTSYFIGSDPAKWRANIPTYAKVKYEGIYSGIDLVYYGNQRQLEFDFIVAPGADPHRIAIDIGGAKRIRRDESGELAFKVGDGEIRWSKPVVYQETDGARREIKSRYTLIDTNRVGIEVAKFDTRLPLHIDPLIYATGASGVSYGYGLGIAADNAGNAYVTGQTFFSDFPTSSNAFQMNYGGISNVFIAKINPAGSEFVYSAYLGGGADDLGFGIAVDGAGNAYVTGQTLSSNFPTTPGVFQRTYGGSSDAFVAKINPWGSALLYSTYLGGSGADGAIAISVDATGSAYIHGLTASIDFPTINPLLAKYDDGGGHSAFAAQINPAGSLLVYSTYLGK